MNSLIYDISDRLPNVTKQFCWCVYEQVRGEDIHHITGKDTIRAKIYTHASRIHARVAQAIKKNEQNEK